MNLRARRRPIHLPLAPRRPAPAEIKIPPPDPDDTLHQNMRLLFGTGDADDEFVFFQNEQD
ncbi:hypothetical protein [Dinoroseobacter sp. S76]|uniref:hypothetical protein n=1 Tax=Dinoroseobacter sp. S76 TaxID=3415124 RepID=UPI003C7AE37A